MERVLQEQFISASNRQVDDTIILEMEQKPIWTFESFASEEIIEYLKATSNFSTLGPDNMSWY